MVSPAVATAPHCTPALAARCLRNVTRAVRHSSTTATSRMVPTATRVAVLASTRPTASARTCVSTSSDLSPSLPVLLSLMLAFFGTQFNGAGGGVYAMQRDSSGGIYVWFFPRGQVSSFSTAIHCQRYTSAHLRLSNLSFCLTRNPPAPLAALLVTLTLPTGVPPTLPSRPPTATSRSTSAPTV